MKLVMVFCCVLVVFSCCGVVECLNKTGHHHNVTTKQVGTGHHHHNDTKNVASRKAGHYEHVWPVSY